MDAYKQQFLEVSRKPASEQAQYFLTAFVMEFQGRFEEVLDLSAEFKKFGSHGDSTADLDEMQAHLYLEKRAEALTVVALRENLKKELKLDRNHNVAFVEYLLWKYNKTVHDLFNPPRCASQETIEKLRRAMAAYEQVLATKKQREDKIAELEALVAKGGVKGLAARNQLDQMAAEDRLAQNRREIESTTAKKKAEKEAEEHARMREAALIAERERLANDKARKEAEEQAARDASKARLKAKASLWH